MRRARGLPQPGPVWGHLRRRLLRDRGRPAGCGSHGPAGYGRSTPPRTARGGGCARSRSAKRPALALGSPLGRPPGPAAHRCPAASPASPAGPPGCARAA